MCLRVSQRLSEGPTHSHRLEGSGEAAGASRRDGPELHKLHVWWKNTEVALGFALLPGASGEGGPGRPEGTSAVAWDTAPAARQWPIDQTSTAPVSETRRVGCFKPVRKGALASLCPC